MYMYMYMAERVFGPKKGRRDVPITRTNSKSYIGSCVVADCEWRTGVIRFHVDCAMRVRDHQRNVHDITEAGLFPDRDDRKDAPVALKQPSATPPPSEAQEQLGDYADTLLVFSDGVRMKKQTQFGDRDVVTAYAWAFQDGKWLRLDKVDVFYRGVQVQIMDASPDPIAGVLHQGVSRTDSETGRTRTNDREWVLLPVPKADKAMNAALAEWEGTIGADF